jgi:hypothetical protein
VRPVVTRINLLACARRNSPASSSSVAPARGLPAAGTIFVGKQRLYNRRFLQMCSHYLVDPVACTINPSSVVASRCSESISSNSVDMLSRAGGATPTYAV